MEYSRKIGVAFVSCLIIATMLCLVSPGDASPLPHHRIEVSFDLTKKKIFGTVEATVPETTRALMVGRGLHITKLEIDGNAAAIRVKDGRINLPKHTGQSRIVVEYEGIFLNKKRKNLANTIGEEGAFLLTGWYPAAEAELAHFSLQAKIPNGFEAVSEADKITIKNMGKEKLVIFDFPHPVTNIHLIMARYVVSKEYCGSVKLETYLLPEDETLAARYLAYSKKYLEMYVDMLGPYPYKRFAVVENIQPTGYGMPTFTLLGRQVLKLPFIPETSLGHEILHSWFGNSVYIDYEKGNWSEGLTSYLADHYYEELQGEGWQYRRKIIEDYESYVHKNNEISIRDFFSGDDRALRAVGYGKTAMFFHMLKMRVGIEAFDTGLKQLVKEQRFRLTSWRDLERIFSKTAGEDLSGFFEFWLKHKGTMAINLSKVRLNQSGKGYDLDFEVRVRNCSLPVPIPVAIHTENKEERKILLVSKGDQRFTFSLKHRAEEIIVDPDYDLFRSLKPLERRAVLSRLLGDPTRTVVLPGKNKDLYQPLIKELKNRGFQVARAEEITHSDLGQKALLFLGPQDKYKFLFPEKSETVSGFSLTIRRSGLDSRHVIGLALAEDSKELSAVVGKLFHYGKYSSLKFSRGRNMEKEIESSERGSRHEVGSPVTGIALESVLSLAEIISRVADKTIVYVGEKHNRYGDHLIQLELIRGLHQRYPKLAIGMEMFQRRYQKALDEYISGETDTQTFLIESRYFSTWRFNYHLYEDILEYAKKHRIPVIALNQDHELVSKVADQGLKQLSQEEKAQLPEEMIFDDEAYEKRLRHVFEMHQTELPGDRAPHSFEFFHQAQILWDETMAETIASFLTGRPEYHIVVLAGSGHLAYGSGIPKRAYRRIARDYAIVLPNPEESLKPEVADFVVFPSEVEAPDQAKLGIMLDTSEDQLKISGLVTGSGAQEAGLEEGDIILAVDSYKLEDIDHLKAYLATKYVGDSVQVKVRRKKETLKLEVELGSRVRRGR